MIVSHEWLKQFVPHTHSAEEIGALLSQHCVTLDGIETLGKDLQPFVVAQVVEAGRHPNSERLWVTKVDDGSGTLLDVVCGAPNVVAGAKYPFARTGTTMPGGLTIEKRKIRGETSNGMLCSARELGLGEDHDGILQLNTDAAPGTPLLDVIAVGDARLDLDVLPNRPDLLSHQGVAREISAVIGAPLLAIPRDDVATVNQSQPVISDVREVRGARASVRIDDSNSCSRYVAVVISGVSVGPSPEWLKRRLESVGQRSISNVVDATNYVLQAFGHPVHAFDLDKLADRSIVVRATHAGESIVTLDGVSRSLPESAAAICDAQRPVALAGVMGGRESEVTSATKHVLLEVAVFDPRFVRRVRRHVGLSTDASYRFERGIDASATLDVARVAAALITQVAGGTVDEFLDVGAPVASKPDVTLRVSRVERLLGVPVTTAEITRRLAALGCMVRQHDNDRLMVTPPSWRHDLGLEVDLIEEVARLAGFDALPDELRPFRPGNAVDDPLHVRTQRVRAELVARGLFETRPMPFTSRSGEGTPRVRNPLAEDEPYLRSSVLHTLAERAEYNLSRMQGNIRLFEIGNVFLPSKSRLPIEETHVGALLMGMRRPPHFTEPTPPSFDQWDAKALAEDLAVVAYSGARVSLAPVGDGRLWDVLVDDNVVGEVRRLEIDRPDWASEALGIELSLGVVPSGDVAPAGESVHGGKKRGRETSDERQADMSDDRQTVSDASSHAFVRVKPLPSTPAAEFDLALLVPEGTSAATVESALRAAAGDLLERLSLFDEYRGEGLPAGFRSVAWRLTFRHPERTLRDKEIEGRRARLLELLDKQLGIRPRAS